MREARVSHFEILRFAQDGPPPLPTSYFRPPAAPTFLPGTIFERIAIMASDFVKRLDDVVRNELLVMRRDYRELIRAIEESEGGGAVVRLHPPFEDIRFEEPEEDLADDVFSARVGRRLKVILEAPERAPGPDEEP